MFKYNTLLVILYSTDILRIHVTLTQVNCFFSMPPPLYLTLITKETFCCLNKSFDFVTFECTPEKSIVSKVFHSLLGVWIPIFFFSFYVHILNTNPNLNNLYGNEYRVSKQRCSF